MADTEPDSNPTASDYTAANIRVLPDLEHIRARPGMYVGGTGLQGLNWLALLLLDDALEAGPCTRLEVDLLADGGCRVEDDGPGIPTHVVRPDGRRHLELAFTEFGVGRTPRGPGVTIKIVNALSERLLVEVRRDGEVWLQEHRRGVPCAAPPASA
jgi:DNA gyrase subunit B